jgi:hypothetical protein
MVPALLFPPAKWTNQPVRLYHGTLLVNAENILAEGVQVRLGRQNTDFGRGFYTTTVERQAQSWAHHAATRVPGRVAAVVSFDVNRDAFAALQTLTFVRGSFDAEDFWSFVAHCRSGGLNHRRLGGRDWYDMVAGPVASSWRQRLLHADVDQISFHTSTAAALLNNSNPVVSWMQNS